MNEKTPHSAAPGFSLFALGFRSLFFLASLGGFGLILIWLLFQSNGIFFPAFTYYTPNLWHAHEMVFAYTMAVIGGFLLTAIRNWTMLETSTPTTLAVLSIFWLMGRVIGFTPNAPNWLIALFDNLYLPMLLLMVTVPLVKAGNRRNYFVIGLVGLFTMSNIIFHNAIINRDYLLAQELTIFVLYMVLLLIVIIAGRVFPMFSQNGVAKPYTANRYAFIERATIPLMITWILSTTFASQATWLWASLAGLNAINHGIRLYGWHNRQIWGKPLIWVLHVSYGMLVLGFVFTAITALMPHWRMLSLHIFTMGCLGTVTIGMMARVSYGHSGRDLHNPPKVLGFVFGALVLAVVSRSILPAIGVFEHFYGMLTSGVLWSIAFALFTLRYLPVWLFPRVDGKPG